jgi:hypothetical protein
MKLPIVIMKDAIFSFLLAITSILLVNDFNRFYYEH